MDRDTLAWVVDFSTVIVGVAAVAALIAAAKSSRSERRRFEEAWRRQVVLDHHARVYDAAADLVQRVGRWALLARARVQARGTAMVDLGFPSDSDETTDPNYLRVLETLGSTRSAVAEALEQAERALDLLYFLIAPDGVGAMLLGDLVLIGDVLTCVRPAVEADAGTGDLMAAVDGSGLREQIDAVVALDFDPDRPIRRIEFVRALTSRYFRGRIGSLVPPPPLAVEHSG